MAFMDALLLLKVCLFLICCMGNSVQPCRRSADISCVQVRSLKNLQLNIRRAKIRPGDTGRRHKFYVTDAHSAEKITKSARLEEIRMSILQNLLYYHPESATELGFGPKARKADSGDPLHPLGPKKRWSTYSGSPNCLYKGAMGISLHMTMKPRLCKERAELSHIETDRSYSDISESLSVLNSKTLMKWISLTNLIVHPPYGMIYSAFPVLELPPFSGSIHRARSFKNQ